MNIAPVLSLQYPLKNVLEGIRVIYKDIQSFGYSLIGSADEKPAG